MIQRNVHEAKTELSKLIERVLNGEDVVIARAGKPVVRLVPYTPSPKPRQFGTLKGKIWIGPEFDAPLPWEIQRYFEGEDDDDEILS